MRASKPLVAAVATIVTLGGLGVSAPLVAARQRPEAAGLATPSQVVDALDDCIQQRFKDINDRFGVARIVRIDETPHRFRPETIAEMSSVRALERARLDVILYVAGPRVMRPTPTLPLVGGIHARAIVKGPVRVTSPTSTDSPAPPSPSALWEEGRRAMQAFRRSESYDFTQPGWNFTSRPVRASEATCLECHRNDGKSIGSPQQDPVKLGDALGVVIYGYRPK